MARLTFEEWERRYKPVRNALDDRGYNGLMFETFGDEFSFIKARSPLLVWTLLDEDGVTWIAPGLHYVNRLGYFATTVSHEDADVEVEA